MQLPLINKYGGIFLEMDKSSNELKKEAKELLRSNWKKAILLNIIPILLRLISMFFMVSFFISLQKEATFFSDIGINYNSGNLFNSEDAVELLFQSVYSFLTAGVLFTSLDWLRNPEISVEPLKNSFQLFTKKYFFGVIVITILTFIFIFLWSLLLLIPGIIKSYSYSQSYFIFKDRKALSGDEKVSGLSCIRESRRLMDGHKQDYFVLELSFIGWEILCILTLGIGYIWLVPYRNVTYAAFYKNIYENKRVNY